MLREPQKSQPQVQIRKDKTTGRFQVVKLEDRIAPAPGPRHGPPDHAQKNK
jgi:hypothetical protein